MHIEINDNTKFREIQEVFNNFYPYLQINFYRKAHKKYEASSDADLIDPELTVGQLKKTHVSGLLEMAPLYKVADVEKEFLVRFGLSAQIVRMDGDNWVQTTGMDDFTLKEVNELSRNSSDEFVVTDYDETFEDEEEEPDTLL